MARTMQPTRDTQPEKRLRREPVQSRSRERMATILDVTAQLVDEVGPDQVTTTLIAERAGISVGSVYSYFQDRSAIFDAIVARSIVTLDEGVTAARNNISNDTLIEGSAAVIDALADLYRSEPGFRSLWFSPHLSPTMLDTMRRSDEQQARRLLDRLDANVRHLPTPDPMVVIRVYVGLIDKCFDLAFRDDPNGDQALIDELKRAVSIYLGAYFTDGAPLATDAPRGRRTT